jgi:hypothetical protein
MSIKVFDPLESEFETIYVYQETHKSFQKYVEIEGEYRICIKGHPDLYRTNPDAKYEMSI